MTTATMNAQAQSGAKGLDAGKNAEASKYDQYVGMVKASGYNLDTSVGNVNVIGIQGWLNGNVVDNVKNKYNDTIVCVYQRKDGNGNVTKHCAEFIASVDPGTYAKVNAKGSANLLYGQHTYQKGTHKGYAAYNPVGPSKVWRDKNNDGKRAATDKDDTGYFGINIHAAGSYKSNVGNWSEGCQVIASKDGTKGANNTEFKRFRDIISKQDKDQKFVYTLLQGKTAWNAYQKDGDNNVAENSGDVLPSNAPENSGAAAQGGRQMNAEGHPIYYPKGAKETQEIINWNKGRNYTADYIKSFQKVIGTKVDGGIGTDTVNAIRHYQEKNGLGQDGKWGKDCADHAKLERKYNSGSAKPKSNQGSASFSAKLENNETAIALGQTAAATAQTLKAKYNALYPAAGKLAGERVRNTAASTTWRTRKYVGEYMQERRTNEANYYDCSAFTSRCWASAGISLNNDTAAGQGSKLNKIGALSTDFSQVQAGDLLFYRPAKKNNGRFERINHIAIAISKNEKVDAGGTPVRQEGLGNPYCFGRPGLLKK